MYPNTKFPYTLGEKKKYIEKYVLYTSGLEGYRPLFLKIMTIRTISCVCIYVRPKS